jgi:NADPH2:quinone reductase
VIGTAGSNEGIELVTKQGADYVFNHRESDYMEKIKDLFPDGLDMIIEMLANVNLNNDLQLLRWKKGRVVVIGNRGTIEVNPRLLMAKETTVTGVTLFTSDEVFKLNIWFRDFFKSLFQAAYLF